jgi:hypothetical protein
MPLPSVAIFLLPVGNRFRVPVRAMDRKIEIAEENLIPKKPDLA